MAPPARQSPEKRKAPTRGAKRRPGPTSAAGQATTAPRHPIEGKHTHTAAQDNAITLGPRCEACGAPAPRWRCYWGPRLCSRCGLEAEEGFERDHWPRAPWEVAPAPAVAVLGRSSLWHMRGEIRGLPASFGHLAAMAEHLGLEEVWVHEEALEALGWPAALERRLEHGAGQPGPFFEDLGAYRCNLEPAGHAPYAKFWVAGGGHGFALHVPAWVRGSRPPWKGTEGPGDLLWALWLYREATGGRWPWRGAGSITSDAWIRNRYRGDRLRPSEVAAPYAAGEAAEADFQWIRPPRPAERRAGLLVAFDVNAAYLGAASTIPLPTGGLEHLEPLPAITEAVPGYWLLEPLEEWRGPGPQPWPARDPCWVTTPTAAYLSKDYGFHALEAWVWPEAHQYLRPWYEDLRRAREACLEVGGPALQAVKTLYKAGLGRLASSRRSEASSALFQPYWEQAVTALARCNLHRRIRKLEAEPIGVQVDALYFLTPARTACAEAFAARIGLPLGEGLGQFKVKGSAPAAGALEVLEAGRSPLATCTALDRLLEAAR